MDVVSSCALRVASVVWQPRPGAWMLTVVCKATYALRPGESPLAEEQEEPNEADGYWNDEETRSLNFASDLAPFKRRADVLVVGHAFAPEGRAVGSLVARVVVGEVDKALAVFGDRAWTGSGAPREASRFMKMPLRWERAAGGPGTTNPVGVRMGEAGVDRQGTIGLPNLQAMGAYLVSPWDVLEPVGFGPIAPQWPGRVEKLRRHAAGWDQARWSERPLPEDVDAAFFNVAPGDQQVGEIRGDERIVLENLHAEHARLVTQLARVEPRAVVERGGGNAEVRLRCDTLWIDTDRGCCSLVWRGQVALAHPREAGRVVVTASGVPEEESSTTTIVGGMRVRPPTPFVQKVAEVAREEEDATITLHPGVVAALETLPFREGPSPLAVASGLVVQRGAFDDGTGTIFAMTGPRGDALPFSQGGRMAPPPTNLPSPVESFAPVERFPERSRAEEEEAPRAFVEHSPVAPPPMIGPLATPEMAVAKERPLLPVLAMVTPVVTTSAAPEPEPSLLSIERFSAISAELAEKRAAHADVLHGHDLTERDWTANEQRWAAALREETLRGSSKLRASGDRAYVEAVEGFRGPITAPEYARLVVALERGQADPALDELHIQRPALMRVVRIWTKKVAGDARLSEEVGELLAGMRGGD